MFSGFDISSLWLCKASTILHCAQRFSYLLTEPLMRSDSLACRLIAPRYSWQTYPDLAVSRLGSEVCENARFQRVLHFWRPNWWMSPGFDNYNKEKQLTCWAMHEDSWCFFISYLWLRLCKASTILHCAQRFSNLLTEPLMRSDSLACRLIVPRHSWQTYPDLAVSRLGSEVCENARFQRVLHFWRPNWWMSLGFDNYNREKQLTCWAMHEDSWCFLVSISALCGYAKHLPSCTENKSSVIYWQNRLWEVIHWHADW